jgi:hypothetical protein
MARTYKVWLCVEEYDDKTDKYIDVDLDFGGVVEYSGRGAQKRAVDLATRLHKIGECIAEGKPHAEVG